MWPATTQLDQQGLKGYYFNFYWRNVGTPAEVTVRFEYRQANLGNFVMAREKTYPLVKGSRKTQFTIIGDDYLENGPVTNWRCLLIVNGKIVGLTQSYLWK
jgi:NDP-sugar pyrophosphorylase family protein